LKDLQDYSKDLVAKLNVQIDTLVVAQDAINSFNRNTYELFKFISNQEVNYFDLHNASGCIMIH